MYPNLCRAHFVVVPVTCLFCQTVLPETYLLQAEEQFSARNFDDAEKLYDDAILSSKKHKFVNEEALANELAGHFYLDTGRKYKSLQYFCQAEEKYREWGAVTKADELATYLRSN